MLFFPRKMRAAKEDKIAEKWLADFPALFRKKKKTEKKRFFFKKEKPLAVRFPLESGDGYEAALGIRGYELLLKRKNLFAWVQNPWFRYDDFVLEAECGFAEDNGYSSLGFCFRQINESSYYFFLVSNRHHFRFDLVFNDNPRVLIPWTPFPEEFLKEGLRIRIVVRGTKFVFLLNDEWVAEAEDDTIPIGHIAWAGQNYGEQPEVRLSLEHLKLESRPMEVETNYFRWNDYVPVEPGARLALAESYFVIEAYTSAIVQIKKISRQKPLSSQELLLLGRSFLGAGLFEEALNTGKKYEAEMGSDPVNSEVIGASLYGLNRFLELRDFLNEKAAELSSLEWYYPLAGNAEYALGNWDRAFVSYQKALEVFPDSPVIRENLLRAQAKMGTASAESYLETARLYYLEGDCEQAKFFINRAKEKSDNPPEKKTSFDADIETLEGKIAFQEERWEDAEGIFRKLAEEDRGDSSVFFLYGLLLNRKGLRPEAGINLEKAADGEPGEFVFQFKAAESRYLRGEQPEPFLSRALAINKEDPWINNLAGLDAVERGQFREAVEFLSKARSLEPENTEILINFSQALFDSGEREKALAALQSAAKILKTSPERSSEEAAVFNQMANLFAAMEDYPGAVGYYEKALAEEPDNRSYRLNCAAACIEADHIHRAEELLQGFGEAPDPEVYNLLGNLSRIRGEYFRAEEAYKAALELEPENPNFLFNLADLFFIKKKYQESRETLEKIPRPLWTKRYWRLLESLDDAQELKLSCAGCDRTWTVPREIPEQGALRLRGEIPGDLPAGSCPQCKTLYCVDCARPYLSEGRFMCPVCRGKLNLEDKYLRYILKKNIDLANN